jgi:hypothetical protein
LKALEKERVVSLPGGPGILVDLENQDFVAPFLPGARPTRRGDCPARKAQRNPA